MKRTGRFFFSNRILKVIVKDAQTRDLQDVKNV